MKNVQYNCMEVRNHENITDELIFSLNINDIEDLYLNQKFYY